MEHQRKRGSEYKRMPDCHCGAPVWENAYRTIYSCDHAPKPKKED